LKSGQEAGANPGIKVKTIWPNNRVTRGTDQVTIGFNEMTQTELTVGCFRLLTDRLEYEQESGSSATISRAMTSFMAQWTDDLLSYEFRTVRGYVKSIFLAYS
jgi:hypothetical protein